MSNKENQLRHNAENKTYWDGYYTKIGIAVNPSNFAKEVSKHLKPSETLIDLGCGNGRDSLYFGLQDVNVIAIDLSEVAINELSNKYQNQDNLKFICGDFTKIEEVVEEKVEYCYSRFTIHAITDEQQDALIDSVYDILKNEGKFFIEVRGINDDIYGKGECVGRNAYIYNEHYRRFIVKDELITALNNKGFNVIYDAEECGFAPYGESDPKIIRIVAKKK